MLPHNKKMKILLKKYGIKCDPMYLQAGSLKHSWRLYNRGQKWTNQLIDSFTLLGFKSYNGEPLSQHSGNGGTFHIFARAPEEINKIVFNQ
jgi:hypothetical protein